MPGVTLAARKEALAPAGNILTSDYVVALQWNPKSDLLAIGSASGEVTLIAAGGKVVRRFRAHRNGLNTLAWSADGRHLATGGQDEQACVWIPETGERILAIPVAAQWVEALSYSPVRECLAIGAGRNLTLWDAQRETLEQYPEQVSTISSIQWQPDSLFFAVGCYRRLSLYSAEVAHPIKEFCGKGSILNLAWSPDGHCIATGTQDAAVHFWYRKTGRDLAMNGYLSKVRQLAWNRDSRLLATGGSSAVTIWSCGGKGPSYAKPIELSGHAGLISALSFQRQGPLLASADKEGALFVWNPENSGQLIASERFSSGISALAWSGNDQYLATGTEDGAVVLFHARAH